MSIELGLTKITKLLSHFGNPHESLRVLHIAGTNGKGSVCSYLASILQSEKDQNNRIGKFTTPHLVHVTDSITVNNVPIPLTEFNSIRRSLEEINKRYSLQCSEFELLTCTAFQYFKDANCNWCVLEVGLGGRLDATNIIPGFRKYACGITKIGLDHETFLGNSLAQIAFEKAGIITEGVKFAVVDGSNDKSVIDVVQEQSKKAACELKITDPCLNDNQIDTESWGTFNPGKLPLNGEYQIFNLRVALSILDHLQKVGCVSFTKDDLKDGLVSTSWPGRLQQLDYCYSNDKTIPLLMDGAHNSSAAVELAKFIRKEYDDKPVTYVIAVTGGKKLESLFEPLIRSNDHVVVTKFSSVDGMPWVQANDPNMLAQFIEKRYTRNVEVQPVLCKVLPNLATRSEELNGRPIVVCGSLYLCGELLRIHNSNK